MMERNDRKGKASRVRRTIIGFLWLSAVALTGLPVMGLGSSEKEDETVSAAEVEGPGGSTTVVTETTFTLPEGLPDRKIDALGKYVRMEGDNFILFKPKVSGDVYTGQKTEGMEYEIVVTGKTILYSMTPEALQGKDEIKEGALEDIREGAMVMVWGEKRGERIIADTVAYTVF